MKMSFGITQRSRRSVMSLAICLIAFAELINAHGYFSSITVDGTAYAEGICMRPHPENQYDYPISSLDRPTGLQSADMTCGWLPAAGKASSKSCAVNPGSTVTFQFHYEMGLGASDTFYIDPSHKGPCLVYMAKASTNGAGNVWFKVFEDGYDTVSKSFCVTRMRANGGKFSFPIPTDITPGDYLLRGELIALHEGDQLYGAQPYVGCAQITVGGSGTVNPPGVAIPGVYTANDAGIHFDIYTSKITSYPIPGPAVYVSGSAPTPTPAPAPTPTPAATTARVVVPATTGKAQTATSTSSGKATTGKSSTTGKPATTGKMASSSSSSSSSSSTSTSGSSSTACSVAGYMKCATSETYQSCTTLQGGALGWAAPQACQTGLTCHPSGNYVYCY